MTAGTGHRRAAKVLPMVFLLGLLAGCGGMGQPSFSARELESRPEWKRLSRRLQDYRRLACVQCPTGVWRLGVIQGEKVRAFTTGDGGFIVSEGLLRIPFEEQDAALANQVAHEVAGHVKKRNLMSDAIAAAFSVVGVLVPGVGMLDFAVNPVAVAVYTREQEFEADGIAVHLLRFVNNDRRAGERLKSYFLRLKSQEAPSDEEFIDGRPDPDDRIAKIEVMIQAERQSTRPSPEYFDRHTVQRGK